MADDPRMGSFDAVMFGVEDDPLLRSVITFVMLLDVEPDRQVIRERAERMTRCYAKLRQRAVGNPFSIAPPRWETDPNFDFDYHIRWRRLPRRQCSLRGVLDYAERMSEQDFDRSRPLWEVAVLSDLDDGQAAVIMKVHHAITDGMGGMAMASVLFDATRDPVDLGPMPATPDAHPANLLNRIRQAARFEIGEVLGEVATAAGYAVDAARSTITDPIGSTVTAGTFTVSAARMLAPQGAPLSTLMTGRSLSVEFSVVETRLSDLQATAAATGASINDVFVAAVVGGLRAYHLDHGVAVEALRVNMPISVRTDSDAIDGNRWIPARFVIPTDLDDPAARIRELHPVLQRAQHDPGLRLSDVVYRVLTALPRPVTTIAAGALMKGVDVAATNVPGPPDDIYLAGGKVTMMIPFAPKAGAAVNIALMSYAGRAFIGINSDPAAVADARRLSGCIDEALLKSAALS